MGLKLKQGFTLIELMIVVAIIGIIAMVGYPSYQNYIVQGNRAAAQQFLMEISNRNQQYLLDNRIYTTSLTVLGLVEPADVTRFYDITVTVNNAVAPRTMTLTATPKVGTTQVSDGALSINHIGTKTPAAKW